MADIPTYYAGQKVAATMRFEHKRGAEWVMAVFVLETDPTTEFHLSGKPRLTVPIHDDNVRSEVLLDADITASHEYGVYTCEALEADYPGGRTVRFEHPVNVKFEIAEENISPPRGIDDSWEWLTEEEAKFKDH